MTLQELKLTLGEYANNFTIQKEDVAYWPKPIFILTLENSTLGPDQDAAHVQAKTMAMFRDANCSVKFYYTNSGRPLKGTFVVYPR